MPRATPNLRLARAFAGASPNEDVVEGLRGHDAGLWAAVARDGCLPAGTVLKIRFLTETLCIRVVHGPCMCASVCIANDPPTPSGIENTLLR
jgi:hypothetical protein